MKVYLLDVDGVLTGRVHGLNFPMPNPKVVDAIKAARDRGDYVSFCTGRALFGILDIIEATGLDTFHIVEGGSSIVNPARERYLQKLTIDSSLSALLVEAFLRASLYVEVYTHDNYYVQEDLQDSLLDKHIAVLKKEPLRVESLSEFAIQNELTKIFFMARTTTEEMTIAELFESQFLGKLSLIWSHSPNFEPAICGWVSPPGITKGDAAKKLSHELSVPFSEFIGVGDSESDWSFLQLCGTAAAMGNGEEELKTLVRSKHQNGMILPHVDENGVLGILSVDGFIR